MRRPALRQERFLDHDQRGQRSNQGTQGRLLLEEGVQVDEVGDHHPKRAQHRQEHHVLQGRTFASMRDDENAGQYAEQQDLDPQGVANWNAVRVRQIGRPWHLWALGINGNFRHAVEGISACRGQAEIASRRVQLGGPHPHPGRWFRAHAPELFPFLAVEGGRHEVDVVVVGLDQQAAQGPLRTEVVIDEGGRGGEARSDVSQPLVALVAEKTVGQTRRIAHALHELRPFAGEKILGLGHRHRTAGQGDDGQRR